MSALPQDLQAHLESGATTLCRCWAVTRTDGVVLGFTDHDVALSFEGVTFRPEAGLSAQAIEQTTGLAVDNTEALGVLSGEAISEADVLAGRYDGARVTAWLVNWREVEQRVVLFAGTIGEIRRAGGAFQAELRGLAEALGQPRGRVYQRPCSAVLGDAACGVDLDRPGYAFTGPVEEVRDGRVFEFAGLAGFAERWFEKGRLVMRSGAAAGLAGVVKNDRLRDGRRVIELWEALRAPVAAGDELRLEAGCDRRLETCRLKFGNVVNYRGFPAIPGEDWQMSVPRRDGANDGGSLSA